MDVYTSLSGRRSRINAIVDLTAGHLPGGELRLQEAGERRHPEPGFLRCTGEWHRAVFYVSYIRAGRFWKHQDANLRCRFTGMAQLREKHGADLHFFCDFK